MLVSKKPDNVTKEDILTLLDGLISNVKHTDDWDRWVHDEDWTDGKVTACLERLEAMLSYTPTLQIEETPDNLKIRVNGKITMYNINLMALFCLGITRGRELAYVLSQDDELLEMFVDDWRKQQCLP